MILTRCTPVLETRVYAGLTVTSSGWAGRTPPGVWAGWEVGWRQTAAGASVRWWPASNPQRAPVDPSTWERRRRRIVEVWYTFFFGKYNIRSLYYLQHEFFDLDILNVIWTSVWRTSNVNGKYNPTIFPSQFKRGQEQQHSNSYGIKSVHLASCLNY